MKYSGCVPQNKSSLYRRDFLRVGSLGFLGISLGQWLGVQHLAAASSKAQSCILLWLEGGPSHIDTWDPKKNSAFSPISTNVDGIQIAQTMPQIARRMDKLSIVRSMHSEEIDHPQATYYAITGHRPTASETFPSVGSIVAKEMGSREGFPAYVVTPPWEEAPYYQNYFGSAFLGGGYDPMIVPDASKEDFAVPDLVLPKGLSLDMVQNRLAFQKEVDRLYREKSQIAEYSNLDSLTDRALQTIVSPVVRKAFDVASESEKTKDAYGRHGFGMSVLLARRMVEAGCRFATAAGFTFNEWDTHSSIDRRYRDELVPKLDQTLPALLDDLEQRGMLESTVVVVMGEFGRTPHVNPSGGRDHYANCWSLALGGGGIRGGQVIGSSDERGAKVTSAVTSVGDVFATVYKALGIDWTKEVLSPAGRPIKIANALSDNTGKPIPALI